MPELPEVETIVRALQRGGRDGAPLTGKTIAGVQLLWERSLALPAPAEFLARLPGQTIQSITRRAKFILIHLDDCVLLIHLRMSGDLIVQPASATMPTDLHTRCIIDFTDAARLVFIDPRKFGRLWLTNDPQAVLGGLGPEPLSEGFTPQVLFQMLQRTHRQIKPLLMDQSFIAGLGNIYTDEALHTARLHPLAPASSLSERQARELWQAIRDVLNEGIHSAGASIDWVYRGGTFQNRFRVYQRTGEPCPVCGTPIERTVVGQRGTHYCPRCQTRPGIVSAP